MRDESAKPTDAPIYGSEEAISKLMPTYGMGGVPEPSRDELAAMQNGAYILHARGGKLTRVPAEKTLLSHDPEGHPQAIHATIAPDGTIYFSQKTILSKSTDGGRTWSSHELTLAATPNSSFQVLGDGTFVEAQAGGPENPTAVVVLASGDEGRTWEQLSEVDNPGGSPVRDPHTLCRLPEDTLLMPVGSSFRNWGDPAYVHRSIDGGKTWSGPTGPYGKPAYLGGSSIGPNTGPGFLGGHSYEAMIASMASGKLLAVIRYHGSVVPHWPLVDPGQHTYYKTLFLSDSEDQGVTWENQRPLTNVHGQCHGFAAVLSDGAVVVTHDHRYPPGAPCARAMISLDEGRTWENEVYFFAFSTVPKGSAGFSESVVLEDDTILTIVGTSDVERPAVVQPVVTSKLYIGNTDVWAIRWRLEKGVGDP